MKSLITSVFYAGLILGMSCKGKGPVTPQNCGANAEKLTAAAQAYAKDASVANCTAYKKELEAFFKSCPTFYSGVTKQELEEFLNDHSCD